MKSFEKGCVVASQTVVCVRSGMAPPPSVDSKIFSMYVAWQCCKVDIEIVEDVGRENEVGRRA